MTHKDLYIELTKLTEIFRENLKTSFSINALVQLTDHSIDETPPRLEDCLKKCSKAFQFQVKSQRGFILFPDDLGGWITSELLGVLPPNESSMLEQYLYHSFIDNVFKKSKLFEDFQEVDVKGVWVHPTFDQFYPMSLTIFKSRSDLIKNWCFIPKEMQS